MLVAGDAWVNDLKPFGSLALAMLIAFHCVDAPAGVTKLARSDAGSSSSICVRLVFPSATVTSDCAGVSPVQVTRPPSTSAVQSSAAMKPKIAQPMSLVVADSELGPSSSTVTLASGRPSRSVSLTAAVPMSSPKAPGAG